MRFTITSIIIPSQGNAIPRCPTKFFLARNLRMGIRREELWETHNHDMKRDEGPALCRLILAVMWLTREDVPIKRAMLKSDKVLY